MPPMELPTATPIFAYLFKPVLGDGVDVAGESTGGVVDVEAEGEDFVTDLLFIMRSCNSGISHF